MVYGIIDITLILNILISACIKLPENIRCVTPRPATPQLIDDSPGPMLSDPPSSFPTGSQGAKSTAVSYILLVAVLYSMSANIRLVGSLNLTIWTSR